MSGNRTLEPVPGLPAVITIESRQSFGCSGNLDFTPERSISRTAGFVYNSEWLPGYDISADYFKMDLLSAIFALPAQTVLTTGRRADSVTPA